MHASISPRSLLMVLALLAALDSSAATDPTEPRAKARPLYATVGPGFVITLKNRAGNPIKSIKRGTYRIIVRDKSTVHNFRLTGRGINRATTVGFEGKKIWTVKLKPGKYTFQCDPHRSTMNGSFRVKS